MQNTVVTVLEEIKKRQQADKRLLVSIDGRCAAGKTTLAKALKEKLDCDVIAMDHFFLPPEKRTEKRLQEPGGNVDYERFLEEVLLPLKAGKPFSYQPYDCQSQSFSEPIPIACKSVSIVEGSYSCHPTLWDAYDLHIFLTITPDLQMQRILHRNGSDKAEIFRTKWIPLEEKYFQHFSVEERCEVRISGMVNL